MERKATTRMIFTLLLMSILSATLNVSLVKASSTIYWVEAGALGDGTSEITPAGNITYVLTTYALSAGDVIKVKPGTYDCAAGEVFPIIINVNGLTIESTGGAEATIIDGSGLSDVVYITASNVTLSNFTIRNSSRPDGSGIRLEDCRGNNICENIVTNNDGGILLEDYGGGNRLRYNNMSRNRYNFGVYSYTLEHLNNDIDNSNLVDGKHVYYLKNYENLTIDPSSPQFPDIGYLGIVNSSNITVKNLKLTHNFDGILLGFTNNSLITNNTIEYNEWNILVVGSNNINITGNSVKNGGYAVPVMGGGIYLRKSSDNKIYHNDFIDNRKWQALPRYGIHNIWDDGYPSGGNYWGDYTGVDLKSGPYQNETGSDGIGDTPYIIDADNQDNYPLMDPLFPFHNIAVTNVRPFKSVVGAGLSMNISVVVRNQGFYSETFDVNLYYNSNLIGTQRVESLSKRTNTTLTFIWNTTGVPKGDYIISANASIVPSEIDTADNTFTDGTVKVKGVGDVNGDGIVDIYDLVIVGIAYGSAAVDNPETPEDETENWNPDADLNNDGIVDIYDLVKIAIHYGKTYPGDPPYSPNPGTVVVSVDPDEITAYKHETFSVNVTVTNVTNLYGWEFKLYWNSTVLNCTGAEIHIPSICGENVFNAGPGIQNDFNTTHGRYYKGVSALYPAPPFNGSMVVVKLTFEAKAVGSTILDLQETKLADSEAYAIPHAVVDAFTTVLPLLTVLAEDQYGNPLTSGDVYIDGQLVGYTGSTFAGWAGTHEVFVNDFWENGTTGYRYGFDHWEDDSVDNPRNITVVVDTTITAFFVKEWCPGDVNGDGVVNFFDVAIVSVAYGSQRDLGDPWPPYGDWDSRADLNCDNIIDSSDLAIVIANYGNVYK